jgi:hypothetical protein
MSSSHPIEVFDNGIRKRYSPQLKREVWGFDLYYRNKRTRRFIYETREDAETAVKILKDDDRRWKEDTYLPVNEQQQILLPPTLSSHCKSGSIGACAEIVVCADLLRRGYDVYRSISPNADCDLIVGQRGALVRVEVKSAKVKGNRTTYHRHKLCKTKYDVLAIVSLNENRILYTPDLSLLFKLLEEKRLNPQTI